MWTTRKLNMLNTADTLLHDAHAELVPALTSDYETQDKIARMRQAVSMARTAVQLLDGILLELETENI